MIYKFKSRQFISRVHSLADVKAGAVKCLLLAPDSAVKCETSTQMIHQNLESRMSERIQLTPQIALSVFQMQSMRIYTKNIS